MAATGAGMGTADAAPVLTTAMVTHVMPIFWHAFAAIAAVGTICAAVSAFAVDLLLGRGSVLPAVHFRAVPPDYARQGCFWRAAWGKGAR